MLIDLHWLIAVLLLGVAWRIGRWQRRHPVQPSRASRHGRRAALAPTTHARRLPGLPPIRPSNTATTATSIRAPLACAEKPPWRAQADQHRGLCLSDTHL